MGSVRNFFEYTLKLTILTALIPAFAAVVAFPSTYQARQSRDTLIHSATIFTGDGGVIDDGYIKIANGIIEAVGRGMPASLDSLDMALDASGKWVTPGIIDVHSHLGDGPSPSYTPHSDVNESTSPVTAEVWAEHSVWPQDPQFPLALAGGVTTLQILPGSANLFGGRSVILKNVSSRTVGTIEASGEIQQKQIRDAVPGQVVERSIAIRESDETCRHRASHRFTRSARGSRLLRPPRPLEPGSR